jgi:hypothetical protein
MSDVLIFCISALRSIVEMLGLCLLGQAVLFLLAGKNRDKNPIYQFFALISRRPQQLTALALPANTSGRLIGVACFLLLFMLWIALAWIRKLL